MPSGDGGAGMEDAGAAVAAGPAWPSMPALTAAAAMPAASSEHTAAARSRPPGIGLKRKLMHTPID
jgi:hypothetical protein